MSKTEKVWDIPSCHICGNRPEFVMKKDDGIIGICERCMDIHTAVLDALPKGRKKGESSQKMQSSGDQ